MMIEPPDPSLHAVDREVRRAVLAMESWEAAMARSSNPETLAHAAPLGRFRSVSGQTALQGLASDRPGSADSPWREGLRRWVGFLTVRRVTEALLAKEFEARAVASARVEFEGAGSTSYREGWKGLLRSRSAVEAAAWLAAIVERSGDVVSARRERLESEHEAARRLGVGSVAALVEGAAPIDLESAAHGLLKQTRDLALALRGEDERRGDVLASTFTGSLFEARALAAPEGWPANLSMRTLVETLRAPADIGHGIRIQFALPDILGASSFMRALTMFGIAYRRAVAANATIPFALGVEPHFVDAYRYGFAFGSLGMSTVYQQRGLGVVVRVAAQQARALAKTALLHARSLALELLLTTTPSLPDGARFEELAHDVYGAGVPHALRGAFPRAATDTRARFAALLDAPRFATELRDRFDEDWFKSPHAWRYLRGRASGPARQSEPDAAPDSLDLARVFEGALG